VANKSQKAPPEDVLTRLRDGHRNDPDIQEIVRLLRLGNFFVTKVCMETKEKMMWHCSTSTYWALQV
jgi:hypothetical protein